MRESSQFGVSEMANWLKKVRQNHHHTLLILGSRAGQLFHSEQFYEILQHYSDRNFHLLSPFARFEESYSILTSSRFTEMDIHNILNTSLKTLTIADADKCLALLIKDRFFDEIISTNIDDALEEVLSHLDLRENRDYDVIWTGRHMDSNDHKNAQIQLIKPFGDLMSRNYIIRERSAHLAHPALKSLLQRLLQHDTVILGLDSTWDRDFLQLIPTQSNSALWFVSEEEDIVEKSALLQNLLNARNAAQILGREGNYEYFLQGVHHYLSRSVPASYELVPNFQYLSDQVDALTNPLSVKPLTYTSIVQTIDQPTPIVQKPPLHADVLLVTVTEVETIAIRQAFYEECKQEPKLHFVDIKTYYELGMVNGMRVFLVQSEMGVAGLGSSLQTAQEGIKALSPSFMIMVGVAFGVNHHKQRIGDILVSKQLYNYECERVGTADDGTQKIIVRGDRVSASATLLDRFRSVSFNWTGQINRGRTGKQKTSVFFGTILSGEKLIDNMTFRDQLLELEPEAIGGEMEGTGLYTAAHRAKVDWILVKAICDWADGNKAGNRASTIIAENGNKVIKKTSTKERDQKRAAKNAARFVLHMLLMTRLN